jgi:hypothetical protein
MLQSAKKCNELDVPVELHHSSPTWTYATARAVLIPALQVTRLPDPVFQCINAVNDTFLTCAFVVINIFVSKVFVNILPLITYLDSNSIQS